MKKVIDVLPTVLDNAPLEIQCRGCTMSLWFHTAFVDDEDFLYCKGCAEQEKPKCENKNNCCGYHCCCGCEPKEQVSCYT